MNAKKSHRSERARVNVPRSPRRRSAMGWHPLAYDFEVRDEADHDGEFVLDFNGAARKARRGLT